MVRDDQWDRIRLESLLSGLSSQLTDARQNGRSEVGLLKQTDRFAVSLDRFLDHSLSDFRYDSSSFQSPWQPIVSLDIEPNLEDAEVAYLMSADNTHGILQAVAVTNDKDLDPRGASIARLREICDEVTASLDESGNTFSLAVTGVPVLEHDELVQAGTDMLFAALIALVAVGALLSFGFRSIRHPMLILLTLVVSLSCTFGVATLVVGHLNILSVCFGAILIGLGVDFGVHFLSRYLHQRQELLDVGESLAHTGRTSGTGILTSALTTALAFGSAALTGYPGIAELGIIVASGIMICAACTFLFLPAVIALSDADTDPEPLPNIITGTLFRKVIAGFPLVVVALSVLGTAGLGSQAFDWTQEAPELKLAWDANLMHLQDPDLESVRAQRRMQTSGNNSILYAVAVADSQQEAVKLRDDFLALPSVDHVSELASRLPRALQDSTRQTILSLRSRVQSLPAQTPRFAAANPRAAGTEFDRLYETLLTSQDPRAAAPATRLDRFLTRFADLEPDKQSALLDAYQSMLAGSLLKEFDRVASASSLEQVQASNIPAVWKNRFFRRVDGQEQWLVKVYPSENVWDDAALATFVQDLRSVSPDVTGIPVQNYESTLQLRRSCRAIALYSLGVISLFLLFEFLRPGQKLLTLIAPALITGFIGYTMRERTGELNLYLLVTIYLAMVAFIAMVVDFRNLRDTLLALMPPLLGAVLMAGAMALLQVNLNPINLIVLPLILGIGVDDGIHIVHDYRRQVAAGRRDYVPSGDTLVGVILTSLTTMVGFDSLLIAGHQGLQSVGIVMAIGVGCCLLVALIPLPAILTLVARHQPPSMEPLVKRTPREKRQKVRQVAAAAESDDYEEDNDGENRPMTRREKRRQARAA